VTPPPPPWFLCQIQVHRSSQNFVKAKRTPGVSSPDAPHPSRCGHNRPHAMRSDPGECTGSPKSGRFHPARISARLFNIPPQTRGWGLLSDLVELPTCLEESRPGPGADEASLAYETRGAPVDYAPAGPLLPKKETVGFGPDVRMILLLLFLFFGLIPPAAPSPRRPRCSDAVKTAL